MAELGEVDCNMTPKEIDTLSRVHLFEAKCIENNEPIDVLQFESATARDLAKRGYLERIKIQYNRRTFADGYLMTDKGRAKYLSTHV